MEKLMDIVLVFLAVIVLGLVGRAVIGAFGAFGAGTEGFGQPEQPEQPEQPVVAEDEASARAGKASVESEAPVSETAAAAATGPVITNAPALVIPANVMDAAAARAQGGDVSLPFYAGNYALEDKEGVVEVRHRAEGILVARLPRTGDPSAEKLSAFLNNVLTDHQARASK